MCVHVHVCGGGCKLQTVTMAHFRMLTWNHGSKLVANETYHLHGAFSKGYLDYINTGIMMERQ